MTDSYDDIRQCRRAIETSQRDAFEKWNVENYYPAMQEVRDRCKALGHRKRRTQSSMTGAVVWDECSVCNGHFNFRETS